MNKKYIDSFKSLAERVNNLSLSDKLVFYVTYTFRARVLVYKPKYQTNGLWFCIANFIIDYFSLKVKIRYGSQVLLEKAIIKKLKIDLNSYISFIQSFIFCKVYTKKLLSSKRN